MPGTVLDKGGKKKTGKDPCPYVYYTLVGKKIIDTYVKYSTSVPRWLRLVRSDLTMILGVLRCFPAARSLLSREFSCLTFPPICALSLS